MVKQSVRWRPVQCKNIYGEDYLSTLPELVDLRGDLIAQILAMPKKKQLDFATAINLLCEKRRELFDAGQIGRGPGQYHWYTRNFVTFISELGFHIALTGDEFDPQVLSAHPS
jgi:hypothetical protein